MRISWMLIKRDEYSTVIVDFSRLVPFDSPKWYDFIKMSMGV